MYFSYLKKQHLYTVYTYNIYTSWHWAVLPLDTFWERLKGKKVSLWCLMKWNTVIIQGVHHLSIFSVTFKKAGCIVCQRVFTEITDSARIYSSWSLMFYGRAVGLPYVTFPAGFPVATFMFTLYFYENELLMLLLSFWRCGF